MKKTSSILVVALLGLLVGVFGTFALTSSFRGGNSTDIQSTTLKNSLEKASNLITTHYNYASVGKYENSHQINGWEIPFTQKNFLLTYQGEVMLGIDTSKIDIDIHSNQITVHCPEVEVLSNTIDESSIEVYDESINLLNPISVEDYLVFAQQQKAKTLQELDEKKVYLQAREHTKENIISLLSMIPEISADYSIEVTFPDTVPVFAEPEMETDDNNTKDQEHQNQTENSDASQDQKQTDSSDEKSAE